MLKIGVQHPRTCKYGFLPILPATRRYIFSSSALPHPTPKGAYSFIHFGGRFASPGGSLRSLHHPSGSVHSEHAGVFSCRRLKKLAGGFHMEKGLCGQATCSHVCSRVCHCPAGESRVHWLAFYDRCVRELKRRDRVRGRGGSRTRTPASSAPSPTQECRQESGMVELEKKSEQNPNLTALIETELATTARLRTDVLVRVRGGGVDFTLIRPKRSAGACPGGGWCQEHTGAVPGHLDDAVSPSWCLKPGII